MEGSDPLVSVVMPAFNSERYIAQAIESVLAQTYRNWELLLCDDGSTDRTRELILSFSDARIRYIGETERVGAFGARNVLLKSSRGIYITFLDADDIMDARRIELQVRALEAAPSTGMVGCQVGFIDPKGNLLRTSDKPTTYEGVLERMYTENVIGGAYVMIRRSTLLAVGGGFRPYFGKLSYQDYDLALLLAEKQPCYNLPEILYYYRQHPHSTSKEISIDRLIARDLVIYLGKQRQKSGVDYLMDGKPHLADEYLNALRRSYYEDPSLVYREYAANFMYNKLYGRALHSALAAVRVRPLRFVNWRTLQYCFRISLWEELKLRMSSNGSRSEKNPVHQR